MRKQHADLHRGALPVIPLVVIGVLLLAGGGVVSYKAYKSHDAAKADEENRKQTEASEAAERIASLEAKLQEIETRQIQTAATATVAVAPSAEDNEAILKEIDALKAQNAKLQKDVAKKTTPAVVSSPAPAPVPPPVAPLSVAPQPATAGLSAAAIIAKVKPSVVSISTRRGEGSGFLVKNTVVVTNAHVVEHVYRTKIGLTSGQVVTGYVAGRDEKNDIAIIVIPRIELPVLAFGNSGSDFLKQGDKIYAFGFPFGLTGEPSFSEGSLSRRVVQGGAEFLEISNTLLPGNSGGPLVNSAGEIVGVFTFTYGYVSSGVSIGESIKFAIPSDRARAEVTRLTDSIQPLSISGQSQIDAFEDFMTELNAISGDTDAVAEYRDYYVKAQDILALKQLSASSSTVSGRAVILAKNVPAAIYQNILSSMVENRKNKALTLASIYDTEIELIKGRLGNNITTVVESNLTALDKKWTDLDSAYDTLVDQLFESLATYTFY